MPDFDSIIDASADASNEAPKSFDSIEDTAPASFDDIEEAKPTSQYETPGQQLLTGVEGAAQGIAGPIATGLELGAHKLGLDEIAGIDTSAEAMKARKEVNPYIHGTTEAGSLAASMFFGVGEAGLLAKGAGKLAPEAATVVGKMGSAAIKGALESGGIQAGDEISKAMIGQGDPEAPVSSALAHIGAAGLFGGAMGGSFNALGQAGNKGLATLENAKLGTQADNILQGMGVAAKAHSSGVPDKDIAEFVANHLPDYKAGVKLYQSGIKQSITKATDKAVDVSMGILGAHALGPIGAPVAYGISQKYLSPIVEKVLEKPLVGVTNKLAIPVISYALSKGQTTGLFNALNHAAQVSKGAKAVANGVNSVLKAGSFKPIEYATDKSREAIKEYIDDGGIEKEMSESLKSGNQEPQEGFAEGGEVDPAVDGGSIASLYPDQNMMMHSAKARISNYLTSLKPNPTPAKLPFDTPVENIEAQKRYDNAVDIAAAPLSILNKVKDGSVRIEDVKHFTSLYPELHQHLSKKFTEDVMNAQMDEEPLSYKKRQALSLFMGVALDSTMTPQSIMAAQSAHVKPQAPQPGQMPDKKPKGNTSKMGKETKDYKTADQAAESDRSSRG